MRCKACRNNGDIADNSSSYVKESGCTNYTLKSVKGHADSKQHRKVEDRNAHAVAKHGRPYTDFTWMATRFE